MQNGLMHMIFVALLKGQDDGGVLNFIVRNLPQKMVNAIETRLLFVDRLNYLPRRLVNFGCGLASLFWP